MSSRNVTGRQLNSFTARNQMEVSTAAGLSRAIDPGPTGSVLTIQADGSPGWAGATGGVNFTGAGQLVYGTGAGSSDFLGIGTANQYLTVNGAGTLPEWTTLTLTTQEGDLLVGDASGDPTPLAHGGDTAVLYSNGTTPVWSATGAVGEFLTINGSGDPEWAAVAPGAGAAYPGGNQYEVVTVDGVSALVANADNLYGQYTVPFGAISNSGIRNIVLGAHNRSNVGPITFGANSQCCVIAGYSHKGSDTGNSNANGFVNINTQSCGLLCCDMNTSNSRSEIDISSYSSGLLFTSSGGNASGALRADINISGSRSSSLLSSVVSGNLATINITAGDANGLLFSNATGGTVSIDGDANGVICSKNSGTINLGVTGLSQTDSSACIGSTVSGTLDFANSTGTQNNVFMASQVLAGESVLFQGNRNLVAASSIDNNSATVTFGAVESALIGCDIVGNVTTGSQFVLAGSDVDGACTFGSVTRGFVASSILGAGGLTNAGGTCFTALSLQADVTTPASGSNQNFVIGVVGGGLVDFTGTGDARGVMACRAITNTLTNNHAQCLMVGFDTAGAPQTSVAAGELFANEVRTAGTVLLTSDSRSKKFVVRSDAEDVTASELCSKFCSVETKKYKRKNNDPDDVLYHGFDADELEAVFPEAVRSIHRQRVDMIRDSELDPWRPEKAELSDLVFAQEDVVVRGGDGLSGDLFRSETSALKAVDMGSIQQILWVMCKKQQDLIMDLQTRMAALEGV